MEIILKNQTAIITGGSSGLGKAIALLFGKNGANVVVNYYSDEEEANEVVADIRKNGGQAIAVQANVGKEDDVKNLFQKTIDEFGALDILIANSGRQDDAPLSQMTLEAWENILNVNLTGQFLCMREAIRIFRGQKNRKVSRAAGKIICMSSVHEVIPWAGHANYAASKGGVSMLMKTLAQEVAAEKIRINAIAPGAIRTPINQDVTEGESAKELLKLIPYGRIGEPEDVANLALFLASDMADYVTGSTYFVDGGMTLYPGFEDNG